MNNIGYKTLLAFTKNELKRATPKCCFATVATAKKGQTVDDDYQRAKPFDQIPGVPSIPVIGSGWAFIPGIGKYDLTRLHKAAFKKYQQYGSLVQEDLAAGHTIVNVFDPDDIEKVFRTEGRIPSRLPFDSMTRVLGDRRNIITNKGLLNSNGEEWYEIRTRVQPHMLKPKNVLSYLSAMDEVALEFVHRLADLRQANHEISELHSECVKWALESIALVAMDTRMGCFRKDLPKDSDAQKLMDASFDFFELILKLEFGMFPFWRKFDTPLYKKFRNSDLVFNQMSMKYLTLAKKRLAEKTNPNEPSTLLETLLTQEGMEEMSVAAVIKEMFAAGSDTTSNTLSFFLYFMAKYPDIQEKVYKEISSLVRTENEPITEKHLNEIRYAKACLKESQRLLPVVFAFSRKTGKDIVLSGYQIPEGTTLIVHPTMANNLEQHFHDAESYKPERWLRGSEKENIHAFTFLPFGFGPRACIGRRIAEQELYTAIIRIINRFRLEYHHEDIGYITRLTNIPDKPLRFEFYDR